MEDLPLLGCPHELWWERWVLAEQGLRGAGGSSSLLITRVLLWLCYSLKVSGCRNPALSGTAEKRGMLTGLSWL